MKTVLPSTYQEVVNESMNYLQQQMKEHRNELDQLQTEPEPYAERFFRINKKEKINKLRIPLASLQCVDGKNIEGHQKAISDLCNSIHCHGYAYITLPDEEYHTVCESFTMMDHFFSLPLKQKSDSRWRFTQEGQLGYIHDMDSQKEMFMIGGPYTSEYITEEHDRIFRPNIRWPNSGIQQSKNLISFKNAQQQYYLVMHRIANTLLRRLLEGIGAKPFSPANHLIASLSMDIDSLVKLIKYYPPTFTNIKTTPTTSNNATTTTILQPTTRTIITKDRKTQHKKINVNTSEKEVKEDKNCEDELAEISEDDIEEKYSLCLHEHFDIGMLTLIPCAKESGLIVLDRNNGQWVQVEDDHTPLREIIVTTGSQMQRLTADYYPATFHAVARDLHQNHKPRMSQIFFQRARQDDDAILDVNLLGTKALGTIYDAWFKNNGEMQNSSFSKDSITTMFQKSFGQPLAVSTCNDQFLERIETCLEIRNKTYTRIND